MKRLCGVILIVLSGLCLICGCGSNGLNEYKAIQSEKLQCYADRRGKENFDNQDWDTICDLLTSGKNEIKQAKNKAAVNSVVDKTKSEIDAVNSTKEYESPNNGTYFITDESWQAHVRMVAEGIGADESWIENVLNGGDPGEEWRGSIAPKNHYYCVIIGNKITVAEFRNCVYRISREDNIYRGDTANRNINFWFEGEELYLRQGNETLKFYKDDSYRLSEASWSLALPKEIQIDSGGEGMNFLSLRLDYCDDYGTHGLGVDTRKANENVYRTVKIEEVWMNQFVVQFDKSQFTDGDNWVRLYCVGGPTIRNDKTMLMLENSEYVLFCVTVNGDKIEIKEIDIL